MILIKDENKNNFYAYKSNCLLSQYIKDNESKMKKEILDFIKKKLSELDIKKCETFNNE